MNDSKNFGILKAYAVPHPPIVLPEIGGGRESEIEATTIALKRVAREIAELAPDTIILSSPHAPLYRDAFFISFSEIDQGDMGHFGFPAVGETLNNDLELAELILEKADRKNIPMFADDRDNRLDHGSLVPLRFICSQYEEFKFLRLGLSGFSAEIHYGLGQIIAESVKILKRRAVFIGSGDLSHVLKYDGPYGFKPEGPKFDQAVTDILARAAFDELLTMPKSLTEPAAQCGLPSFQIMAGTFDGKNVAAELLSYEGTFGVGYAVLEFEPLDDNSQRKFLDLSADEQKETGSDSKPQNERNSETSNASSGTQNDKQKESAAVPEENPYVSLARYTIEEYITKGIRPDLFDDLPAEMTQKRAATFVSLHKNGRLRGCIGTLEPYQDSLAAEIQHNAISAATGDPRFSPVRANELQDLEISVDVLSPAEKINNISDLDPKRYGVIVSSGSRRGVLLPDLEGVDTAEEQVAIARQKAGIGADEKYQLKRFEVIRYE
ncbi:MAG TPA: AmmeMemoRadiSam system protein A [Clostridiaceae bacterium]|nr:AmmeMemoRadiSam system protein A [Clostridiaceae bacterium]